ncbi:MAG: transposase [Chloroflexi bacterium]|nr:transposase [Chloroflexota bacterium]MYK33568.1 transposase [Chloroflexota bacterium]
MPDQPTFADLDYACKKRKTRREVFLERMDRLVPWGQLEERIRPHYPTAGRRPYPLATMLRVHCVQLFYNLSDPGMEDLLYGVESVRRFVGLRLSDGDLYRKLPQCYTMPMASFAPLIREQGKANMPVGRWTHVLCRSQRWVGGRFNG